MNILTFDIEEWFHVFEDHNNTDHSAWDTFEKRLPQTIDSLLLLLKENEVKATFFCIGWVVRKYPEIIKKIDSLGFEIGSHSDFHKLAHTQTPKEFDIDLRSSIDSIEQLIGKKVVSYRAPGFSITQENLWAFDSLVKNGILYDSSVFPIERKIGGLTGMPSNKPFIIENNGTFIREFPMNSQYLLNKEIIFSGGGFFRMLPYPVIKSLMKKSEYVMTYLHPRDFDNEQPFNSLSIPRHIKSRIGTKNSLTKLDRLVKDFSFVDIKQASEKVDWVNAEIFRL
jgi:polysaccharide deacetylase family protein (PEP-CTERM system associated)